MIEGQIEGYVEKAPGPNLCKRNSSRVFGTAYDSTCWVGSKWVFVVHDIELRLPAFSTTSRW